MKGHILSLILLVLGVVVFLVMWLAGVKILGAIVVGLLFVLLGLLLYRRGK